MPKAILKRRLNFMTDITSKETICNVPKGLTVHILKQDGKQALILWKRYTKWINANYFLKMK